jgi:hypothetical protein
MYGVGFSSAAIQPYFNRNIYANFGRQTDPAFWGWSRANHAKDMTERLGSENVAYVIVGYASDSERQLWTHIVKESGYEFVKRFDGGIFWRTSVLQPEAVELYKRGEHARDFSLESVVNMADERASAQLESGFYELSDHAWRWTARGFSVALQRPRGSENTGARLVLQVFVPETQIQKLGRMKLTVWVAGHRLQPFRLEKGGAYTCVRDVPAADLYAAVVPLAFKLDKAASPSKSDERELGIVVSSIGLFAN